MASFTNRTASAAALFALALSALPIRADIWNSVTPMGTNGISSYKYVDFSATTTLRSPVWSLMPNGAKAIILDLTSYNTMAGGDCWEINTQDVAGGLDTRIWIYKNGGYVSINDNGRPGYPGSSIAHFWVQSTLTSPVTQVVYVAAQTTANNNNAFYIQKSWLGSGSLGNCASGTGFSTVINKNGVTTLYNTN